MGECKNFSPEPDPSPYQQAWNSSDEEPGQDEDLPIWWTNQGKDSHIWKAVTSLKPSNLEERTHLCRELAAIADEYALWHEERFESLHAETINQLEKLTKTNLIFQKQILDLGDGARVMLHRRSRSGNDQEMWHKAGGEFLPGPKMHFPDRNSSIPEGVDRGWDESASGIFSPIEASPLERMLYGLSKWTGVLAQRMRSYSQHVGNRDLQTVLEGGTAVDYLALNCCVCIRKASRDPKQILVRIMKKVHQAVCGEEPDNRKSQDSKQNQWGRVESRQAIQVCADEGLGINWAAPRSEIVSLAWAGMRIARREKKTPSRPDEKQCSEKSVEKP